MRIGCLVYACLSTFALGECGLIKDVKDVKELVPVGSRAADGGSRASAEGLGFHGQHPGTAHPNDGLHTPPHPGGPSSSGDIPDDIFDYVANYKPEASPQDLMDQFAEHHKPEIPRLPHPDEWKIKTWWIKRWRPIGKRLRAAAAEVLRVLSMASLILESPVKYRFHPPIPLKRLSREPVGVWETFKPASKQSWTTWVKNKIGLGPNKMPVQSHEQLVKHLEGPINEREDAPRESEWRTPEYPPIFSGDPLNRESYKLGAEIHKLKKDGLPLDPIKEKLMDRLYGENPAAQYSEENAKRMAQFVTSDGHLEILERLYLKRNKMLDLHGEMQGILNGVVSALGGEEETSKTFHQILQYHRKLNTEEGHIGDEPKKVDPDLFIKIAPSPLLRQLDPAAHKMHLSPLLYLEEVLTHLEKDSTVGLKAASGYLDSTPRIEVLRLAAKKVEEYAELSREVDTLQQKVLELKYYIFAFRKSDFHDAGTMEKIFENLLNPEKVYTGIRVAKKSPPS